MPDYQKSYKTSDTSNPFIAAQVYLWGIFILFALGVYLWPSVSSQRAPHPQKQPTSHRTSKPISGRKTTPAVEHPQSPAPTSSPSTPATVEPDFGPYIKELQRRIKENWHPPRLSHSTHMVLFFSLNRRGELLNARLNTSSGVPQMDQAGLEALERAMPFIPLPADFRGEKIDVEFVLDYDVSEKPARKKKS